MSTVVILGAGISGHTAALHLRRMLGKQHTVHVVSPNSQWNWIPSNIWVGVGRMSAKQVTFPIAPIYKKKGVVFTQAKATEIHPKGSTTSSKPYIVARGTSAENRDQDITIEYDYLINATGPKLNFTATEGLGPEGNSLSVCTYGHATEAAKKLEEVIDVMKAGTPQTLVVGMGHGMCTCEGAAFEYTFNVEHELVQAGVRDKAELIYLTNENELGDFGVAGMTFEMQGNKVTSQQWMESLFNERGVKAIIQAHVEKVEPGVIHYEQLDGSRHTQNFDFAMLLPPFGGVGLTAFDRDGNDITSALFAPSGLMKVDADYTAKPHEEWKASDWPSTYQSPAYSNIFAVGIAFAPPHQMSVPRKSPNGTVITPAPPRTGMPSGIMGKAVAMSIRDMIAANSQVPSQHASMADMGAACIASSGTGLTQGTAAAMTMYPIIPDYDKYPGVGRSLKDTFGELGLAAHWMKLLLHYLFIYKAKAKPLWHLIPE